MNLNEFDFDYFNIFISYVTSKKMLISKFHHSKIVICQIDTFFEWTYDIEVLDVFDVSERFWSASDMSSTDFRLRRFCQQKNASVTHIGDLFSITN